MYVGMDTHVRGQIGLCGLTILVDYLNRWPYLELSFSYSIHNKLGDISDAIIPK